LFVLAARYLKNRISVFANLPLESLDKRSIAVRVREIGAMPGVSKARREVA